MRLWDNSMMAIKALKSNWLRAILTTLIIAFGIMALVGILTATDSIVSSMSDSFSSLGSNTFSVQAARQDQKSVRSGRTKKRAREISYSQAKEFKERFEFPGVVSISFPATYNGSISTKNKRSDNRIRVLGVDENYLQCSGQELSVGRFFTAPEARDGSYSIVIGSKIAEEYFKSPAEALGKSLKIDALPLHVVGVLKEEGSNMNNNTDQNVLLPLFTASNKYASPNEAYSIKVKGPSPEMIDELIGESTGLMRSVRKLRTFEENDFEFTKSDHILKVIKENTRTIRIGTIVIALITLLGAAIGLMNIMLVSVTERTREIGISKAIGASSDTVLRQFLYEAVLVSVFGGIFGIILGIFAGNAVSLFTGAAFYIPWTWILLAIVLCLFVGVASGMLPAIKASKLDPVEALRYE